MLKNPLMLRNNIFILLMIAPFLTRSQVNVDEAMAAFLLAEEFYAKSDYNSSLGFIEKSKKSFGGGNCKIYYLEVLIRNEIYRTNKNQYEPLMAAISAFQSSKDIETFNREKVIEIIKLKMLLSQEEDNKKMADSIALEEKLIKEQLWDRIQFRGWPLNVKFNDLMVMKDRHPFFLGKRDTYTVKDHPRVYHIIKNVVVPNGKTIGELYFSMSSAIDSVAVIGVDNGIIHSYQRLKFSKNYYDKDAFSKVQAYEYIKNLLDRYSQQLGFTPYKIVKVESPYSKVTDYVWTKNEKNLFIRTFIYEMKKTVTLQIYEMISSQKR